MEIIIKASPKEIAELLVEVEAQLELDTNELAQSLHKTLESTLKSNC